MESSLINHINELKLINKHRTKWLLLTAVVIAAILFVIFDWNDLRNHNVLWIVVSLGSLISIIWWYWTMKILRTLISHRSVEAKVLTELYNDIKEIREQVKKITSDNLTK